MKVFSSIAAIAVAAGAMVACGDDDTGPVAPPANAAVVRLINASDSMLTVYLNGEENIANRRIAFSQASACIYIDPASPAFGMKFIDPPTGLPSGTVSGFTPSFPANSSTWIVASTNVDGSIAFKQIEIKYTPTAVAAGATPNAGLRVFQSWAGQTLDWYANNSTPAVTLSAATPKTQAGLTYQNVGSTTNNGYIDIPANTSWQSRLTTAGSFTPVTVDGATVTLIPGQLTTLLIGKPASAFTPSRPFYVSAAGC